VKDAKGNVGAKVVLDPEMRGIVDIVFIGGPGEGEVATRSGVIVLEGTDQKVVADFGLEGKNIRIGEFFGLASGPGNSDRAVVHMSADTWRLLAKAVAGQNGELAGKTLPDERSLTMKVILDPEMLQRIEAQFIGGGKPGAASSDVGAITLETSPHEKVAGSFQIIDRWIYIKTPGGDFAGSFIGDKESNYGTIYLSPDMWSSMRTSTACASAPG
jgi:hypothetical protein